jgi:hypothetical protein
VLRRDTGKAYTPAPETLRDDMAALLHWAEINARLNPPPARSPLTKTARVRYL